MSDKDLNLINVLEYLQGTRAGYGYLLPELERLTALVQEKHEAIARVRELHKPDELGFDTCIECNLHNRQGADETHTFIEYPCPTIKALDSEQ